METTTSFDLNHTIQQWRESLEQSPAFRTENLDELESHLRDSMAALEARGLSVAEAFLVATRRVGASQTLESEFGKVNRQAIWLDRLFWMLIGYQVWVVVSGAIRIVTLNAVNLGLIGAGYDFKSHGYVIPGAFAALMHLAGFVASLALCWWLLRRKGQRFGRGLGRWLDRKTTWAATFGVLYLLWLVIGGFGGITNVLYAKFIGQEQLSAIFLSQSIGSVVAQLVTPAIFIGLTLLLARTRARASEAPTLA